MNPNEMPPGKNEAQGEETHEAKVNRIIERGIRKLGKGSLVRDAWVERFRSWSVGGSKDEDIRKAGGFDGWTNEDFKKYLDAVEAME